MWRALFNSYIAQPLPLPFSRNKRATSLIVGFKLLNSPLFCYDRTDVAGLDKALKDEPITRSGSTYLSRRNPKKEDLTRWRVFDDNPDSFLYEIGLHSHQELHSTHLRARTELQHCPRRRHSEAFEIEIYSGRSCVAGTARPR
jgi:hypothetical protein